MRDCWICLKNTNSNKQTTNNAYRTLLENYSISKIISRNIVFIYCEIRKGSDTGATVVIGSSSRIIYYCSVNKRDNISKSKLKAQV